MYLEEMNEKELELFLPLVEVELEKEHPYIEGIYGQCCFNYDHPEIYGEHGWDETIDKKEPIVFFKYTGESKTLTEEQVYSEKGDFYRNVVANTGDDAYDDAYALRDKDM